MTVEATNSVVVFPVVEGFPSWNRTTSSQLRVTKGLGGGPEHLREQFLLGRSRGLFLIYRFGRDDRRGWDYRVQR